MTRDLTTAQKSKKKERTPTLGISQPSLDLLRRAYRDSAVSPEEDAQAREKLQADLRKALNPSNPPQFEYTTHGCYSTLELKR
jgi:hypothetical protein